MANYTIKETTKGLNFIFHNYKIETEGLKETAQEMLEAYPRFRDLRMVLLLNSEIKVREVR